MVVKRWSSQHLSNPAFIASTLSFARYLLAKIRSLLPPNQQTYHRTRLKRRLPRALWGQPFALLLGSLDDFFLNSIDLCNYYNGLDASSDLRWDRCFRWLMMASIEKRLSENPLSPKLLIFSDPWASLWMARSISRPQEIARLPLVRCLYLTGRFCFCDIHHPTISQSCSWEAAVITPKQNSWTDPSSGWSEITPTISGRN